MTLHESRCHKTMLFFLDVFDHNTKQLIEDAKELRKVGATSVDSLEIPANQTDMVSAKVFLPKLPLAARREGRRCWC